MNDLITKFSFCAAYVKMPVPEEGNITTINSTMLPFFTFPNYADLSIIQENFPSNVLDNLKLSEQ